MGSRVNEVAALRLRERERAKERIRDSNEVSILIWRSLA